MNIVWALVWFSVISFGLGIIIAFAGKKFAVKADEIAGETMGELADNFVRYRAQVMCSGTSDKARPKYEYTGIADCIFANSLAGGAKACSNACVGFGTCVKSCKFGAIIIIDGVAVVDCDKCTGCGLCVLSCPKKIIKLIPFDSAHWVGCASQDKAAVTKKNCDAGCIACKLCEKVCDSGAIKANDAAASIDYANCTACGKCSEVCPRNIIRSKKMHSDPEIDNAGNDVSDAPQI